MWYLLYCNHRRTKDFSERHRDRRDPDTRNPGFHGTVSLVKPRRFPKNLAMTYGGLRQWAVEKLPTIESEHPPSDHGGTRQWADWVWWASVQNCSNADRTCAKTIKEEYSSRKPFGFPSMEGTPKNTFVWTRTNRPKHTGVHPELRNTEDYAKGHCSLNFGKK